MKKSLILFVSSLFLVAFSASVYAEKAPQKVVDLAKATLAGIGTDPVIIKAVQEQNSQGKTLDQIKGQDEKWKATAGVAGYMQAIMDSECSKHLAEIQNTEEYYAEIFVMDNKGASSSIGNIGENVNSLAMNLQEILLLAWNMSEHNISPAGIGGHFLEEMVYVKDGIRSKRASSWDRTGANYDAITINSGETAVLADIEGAGCIRHIYFTTKNAGHSAICFLTCHIHKLTTFRHELQPVSKTIRSRCTKSGEFTKT